MWSVHVLHTQFAGKMFQQITSSAIWADRVSMRQAMTYMHSFNWGDKWITSYSRKTTLRRAAKYTEIGPRILACIVRCHGCVFLCSMCISFLNCTLLHGNLFSSPISSLLCSCFCSLCSGLTLWQLLWMCSIWICTSLNERSAKDYFLHLWWAHCSGVRIQS